MYHRFDPSDDCVPKLFLLLSLSLYICALFVGILDLFFLENWLSYCIFRFSLRNSWLRTGDELPSDIKSISELRDSTCVFSYSASDFLCPEFCTALQRLDSGGKIMLSLGIAALFLTAVAVVVLAQALFWKVAQGPASLVLIVLPLLCWCAGLAAYVVVTAPWNLDAVEKILEADLGIGFGVSLAVAGMLAIATMLGVSIHRRTL